MIFTDLLSMVLHNFWTSTHRGKLPPFPLWRRHCYCYRCSVVGRCVRASPPHCPVLVLPPTYRKDQCQSFDENSSPAPAQLHCRALRQKNIARKFRASNGLARWFLPVVFVGVQQRFERMYMYVCIRIN